VSLRVSFRGFWSGFDPSDFFLPLVESAVGRAPLRVEPWGPCDLEFVGRFPEAAPVAALPVRLGRRVSRLWTTTHEFGTRPPAVPSPQARASIWFTGENTRPPLDSWRRTWSFDPDSDLAKNTYLPIWRMLFPELLAPARVGRSGQNRLGRELTLDEVAAPRPAHVSGRPRFACLFTSHREPSRMRLASALSQVGEVDVFGRASGRVVESKLQTASQYRFMICPENDLYPGYVTEKPFDAWGAGCLPVWSGLDAHGDLNPDALLNFASASSLDSFVEQVARLDADPDLMDEMGGRALLARRPTLDRARNDVLTALDAG
jgi:hypothetical protein